MAADSKQVLVKLNLPVVEKNRILFSWHPNSIFRESGYWVQYPDLAAVEASEGKLAEALFPLCLAFTARGAEIKLPVQISEDILNRWRRSARIAAFQCFRNGDQISICNGNAPVNYRKIAGSRTALCFGGGAESLLTLGQLFEEGVHPILASLGGPAWSGSDPETNPDKFRMDDSISRDLGLELLRVRTNFKTILNAEGWEPYLKNGVSMVNTVLLLPFFISFIVPVAEDLGIRRVVNGNEKMNFPHEYFCFSPPMTASYHMLAEGLAYESYLETLYKEEVCRVLYQDYPHLAKYQYSCWRNRCQRWCYQCESCLEYFALIKNYGTDPALIGLEESKIRSHRRELIRAVAQSAEGRPGEIWERLCEYPDLRRNPWMREVLDEIKKQSKVHLKVKQIYDAAPHWLKAIYRNHKAAWKRMVSRRDLNYAPIHN